MKDIRLMHEHSAKCPYRLYREDNPGSPWFFDADPPIHYRLNWRSFVEAICNDPDCKGRLRVATNWIEDQLPAFIPEDQSRSPVREEAVS